MPKLFHFVLIIDLLLSTLSFGLSLQNGINFFMVLSLAFNLAVARVLTFKVSLVDLSKHFLSSRFFKDVFIVNHFLIHIALSIRPSVIVIIVIAL